MKNYDLQRHPSMVPMTQSSRCNNLISFATFFFKTMKCYKKQTQRGSTLIYIVAVMLIGSALGAGIVSMTTSSTFTQLTYNQSDQARWLAQSGLEYADKHLNAMDRSILEVETNFNDNFGDNGKLKLKISENNYIELIALWKNATSNHADFDVHVIGIVDEDSAWDSMFELADSIRVRFDQSSDWEGTIVVEEGENPPSQPFTPGDIPTQFTPYEYAQGQGLGNPLVFGEVDDEGAPEAPYTRLGGDRFSCVWTKDTFDTTSGPFNVCFRFQFFPGETVRDQVEKTADGFTMTLLPGDLDIYDSVNSPHTDKEDDSVVCGYHGSNIGYGGIRSEKMAIEFDIHRFNPSWSTHHPNDPEYGNHAAILLSEDYPFNDPADHQGAYYNVRHDHNLNPACDPGSPNQSSCVFMYESPGSTVNLPAWMEWRNCNPANPSRDYSGCEMERVDETVWGGANRTFPHTANVSISRGCNSDCSECGIGESRTRVQADVYCLYGSSQPGDTYYCGLPRNIDACVETPLNESIFDEVRLGFTTATGGATTGLQISHTNVDCNPFPQPVANYRFDACSWDGSTDEVIDSSGNENHGTAEGGATTVAGGIVGRAGLFIADEDQYIDIPHSPDLEMSTGNQVTVAGWIKQTSDQTDENWITILSKSDQSYTLQLEDGDMPRFTIHDGSFNGANADNPISLNTWYHLAGTFDGETVKIYVNGILQTEQSTAGQMSDASGDDLYIAENSGNRNRYFDGYLDEFKIFDVALSPARIYSMYYNEFRGLDWDGLVRDPITCPIYAQEFTLTSPPGSGQTIQSQGYVEGSIYGQDITLNDGAEVTEDIVGEGDVTLISHSEVGGEICAGGDVTIEHGSVVGTTEIEVTGDIHAHGNVNIVSGAHVHGDIYATGTVTIGNGAQFDGQVFNNPKTCPRACLPEHASFSTGTRNFYGNWQETFDISPGTYGELNLGGENKLYLSGGDYYFSKISTGTKPELYLDLSADDINIFVSGNVVFGDNMVVYIKQNGNYESFKQGNNIKPNIKPLASKVYLETLNNFTINSDGEWFGTIFAKNNVSFGSKNTLVGSYHSSDGQITTGDSMEVYFVESNYANENWEYICD